MPEIDINCDMGESFGNFKIGNDEAIFPFITSCNIACGFHGGDPLHIENTIKLALKYGVQIGAHPSYPDLQGFGRRNMSLNNNELKAILKYQIAALKGMTESLGGQLKYVKPHGALYNAASKDERESNIIIEAIQEIDPNLVFMGLAGSVMEKIAVDKDISFVAEAFADRRYNLDGKLMSRSLEGSVIHNSKFAVNQVLSLINENEVETLNGTKIKINAESICIHGDNTHAIEILKEIDKALITHNILKKGFAV